VLLSAILLLKVRPGGKSELHRAGCRVTPGVGICKCAFSESAAENIPPALKNYFLQAGKGEMAR